MRPLKRELEKLEQRIAQLEAEKQDLERRMGAGLPAAEVAEAGRRLKQAASDLGQAEERWMELSSQVEAIGSGSN
jgi:ATP-binding cassette subfamily F protein 3